MNILHIVDIFDPSIPRDQEHIVRYCCENGYNVTVLSTRFDSENIYHDKAFWHRIDYDFTNIRFIRPYSIKIRVPTFKPLLSFMPNRAIWEEYDVIHVYTIGSYSSLLLSILPQLKYKRIVLRGEFGDPVFKRINSNFAVRLLAMRIVSLSNAIYVFSEDERKKALTLGVSPSKLLVLPPGIDYKRFSVVSANKNGSNVVIGYLGRLIYFKGSHRLVKPLSRIICENSNIKVVFAGPMSEPEYAKNVLGLMSKNKQFQYLGFVLSAEFFKMCDIVVVPSVPSMNETGSISTLEAMAAGKAVIATNMPPMNEYIKHGVNGLLFDSEEDIYKYCKLLIENTELRNTLCSNARREASKYDWDVMFKKLDILYNNTQT